MKASELREKDVQQLQDELIESLKEQFKLRMQKGAGGDARPSEFKRVRRNIARIKTILTEKKRAGEKA